MGGHLTTGFRVLSLGDDCVEAIRLVAVKSTTGRGYYLKEQSHFEDGYDGGDTPNPLSVIERLKSRFQGVVYVSEGQAEQALVDFRQKHPQRFKDLYLKPDVFIA